MAGVKGRSGSKPGRPKTPGSGRKPGVPNKFSADVKAMVLEALDKGGGAKWLQEQMTANPGPFMALLGKILPTQITGRDGGPIEQRSVYELSPALQELIQKICDPARRQN